MYLKLISIKEFLIYFLYCITILMIAYFLDRFFQMLMFILFFNLIQNSFLKRFHADTIFVENPIKAIRWCKVITLVVEIVYLIYCKQLDVSIYSNLLIVFVIATSNALLQFFLERAIIRKVNLSHIGTLTLLCMEANLTDNATKRMIMKYVEHKTYKEIADIECVDEDSIKSSIRRSRRKLNI